MGKPSGVAKPLEGFSIRAVARIAGVEPDTLRVWERRYGFPKPSRTAGGARVYSSADVELLQLIAAALKLGFRAGEVVGRTRTELLARLAAAGASPKSSEQKTTPSGRSNGPLVEQLLDALVRGEVATLRKELRSAAITLGPKGFVTDVAAPLATRLGDLWELGAIAIHHEHLLSMLLATQLRMLLVASEEMGADKSVLLATPRNEHHGLGLDMVSVYLAFHQVQPRVLGTNTPADQIVEAARSLRVDAVGLTISAAADLSVIKPEVEQVLRTLPAGQLCWLGGAGASMLGVRGPSVRLIEGWADLDDAIRELRGGPRSAAAR